MRKTFVVALVVLMSAAALFASGAGEKSKASGGAGTVYKIALCNSYTGNDWRQEMEKTVQVVAAKSPYKERCTLDIVNTENTAEAQSAAIDNLVQKGYNAILVDASSGTALNPAIERAAATGVVIVSFDQVVTSEKAWKVHTDFDVVPLAWATFVAKAIGGKGNIAFDRGLPGAPISEAINKVARDTFAKYPGIKIVGEFDGKYAEGEGQQGMATVLAVNPQIDGVFSQNFSEPIIRAFKEANRPLVPMCVFDTNGGMVALVENNVKGLVANNIPGLSAIALKLSLQILDGANPPKDFKVNPGLLTTDTSIDLGGGLVAEKLEIGKNCFKDLPATLDWPVLPADFGVTVTPQEIMGK
jgi:ribose transport system substrate-binding protein